MSDQKIVDICIERWRDLTFLEVHQHGDARPRGKQDTLIQSSVCCLFFTIFTCRQLKHVVLCLKKTLLRVITFAV